MIAASQPNRIPAPRMKTAASDTLPAGRRSTGTGYASAKIAAASRTTIPAVLPAEGGVTLYPQIAAPSEAAPPSVTGSKIGSSRRVSAFPRPQLCLLPARFSIFGADSSTALGLPEESEAEPTHRRRDADGRDHESRKLESPVHHLLVSSSFAAVALTNEPQLECPHTRN